MSKGPKVLIVNHMHPSIISKLEAIGYAVDYQPTITAAAIPQALADATGMIIRSKVQVEESLLQHAPLLRFVGRAGAGVDNVNLADLDKRNITLVNAPEGNRDALAEHSLGMLLALFNHIHLADQQVRQGIWDREGNRGIELGTRTVGILGFGHMGQAFAKRLSGIGCEVITFDKYKSGYGNQYAQAVSEAEFFARTQVLSIHIPLSSDNRYLVDEAFLNRFTQNLFVLNTARGEVLDLAALVAGMKSGKVLGAALDVLENEKLDTLTPEQAASFAYLRESDRTLLSPHVAGWSHESYERINQTLVEKIQGLGLI